MHSARFTVTSLAVLLGALVVGAEQAPPPRQRTRRRRVWRRRHSRRRAEGSAGVAPAAARRGPAKWCWRGPIPAMARRNTIRSRTRWQSSNVWATSQGAYDTYHPYRFQHHLEEPAQDDGAAGEWRTEPEQRRRDLLHGTSRRAARRGAEGRAPVVCQGRRQGIRGGACRAHGVRIVAGVRRTARRPLRWASDQWAGCRHQRRRGLSGHEAFPGVVQFHRRVLPAEGVFARQDSRAAAAGSLERAPRTRTCIAPTATTRWPGRRCTARDECSSVPSPIPPRRGTSGTFSRCTSRPSSGLSGSPTASSNPTP